VTAGSNESQKRGELMKKAAAKSGEAASIVASAAAA